MRKVKTVVILLSLALISFPVLSLQPEESSAGSNFVDDLLFTPAPRDALDAYSTEAPTLFSPNLGQLDNSIVQFYVRGGGFWVARDGIWFSLEGRREKGEGIRDENQMEGYVVKQTFVGANEFVPEGRERVECQYNFYYGNDPSKWRAGVPNYQELYFENLYDKIDLRYYSKNGELKYDFIVAPGGDPSLIRIRYEGTNGLAITEEGDLLVRTPVGDIIDRELYIYQELVGERKVVEGEFRIFNEFEYGFELKSEFDPAEVLVIDPYIQYSSFLGGQYRDRGEGIDLSGSYAFVTGYTNSDEFPTTTGAYDIYHSGNYDAFVTKFNHNGSGQVYSTYLGAVSDDRAYDIKVNSADEVFITGSTASSTFPTTSLVPHKGLVEAFVAKLNSSGKILYSSMVGGSDNDIGNSIAINAGGYAFVTGQTTSDDFPTTAGALNESHNGNSDIIVFKLNPAGNALEFATYIGGTYNDIGNGITVDQYDYPYVVGTSESDDFPTTAGAYMENYYNNNDAIIFKLNTDGSALQYSTYYGGAFDDSGNDIAVDENLEAYVTGSIEIIDSGGINGFVIKLDAFGQSLKYDHRFKGNDADICYGIALDQNENAYITGVTESSELYTVSEPGETVTHFHQGNKDVFVYKIDADGQVVKFFTYIGGERSEEGADIALDDSKNIYLTGYTSSTDFPVTSEAFDSTNNLNDDAFVLKISFEEKMVIDSFTLLKDNEPVSLVYSQHEVYTFKLVITNTYSPRDLRRIDLFLDPDGISEHLECKQHTFNPQHKEEVPEYFEFFESLTHGELQSSSSVFHNGFEVLTFDFDVVFDWDYPDENNHDIEIDLISDFFGKSSFTFPNMYQVENDLKLQGNLSVLDENNNTLNTFNYVRGGSWLLWTDLTVVYEGTTDVYPSQDIEVTITDEIGAWWQGSVNAGSPIEIFTKTPTITIADSFDYTINITNVPAENVPFGRTFSLRVDNDTVRFFNPFPADNVKSKNLEVGITIYDEHSEVDADSIQYSYSLDGGAAWTDWEIVEGYTDADEIYARVYVILDDGTENRIRWRATDTLGNGPALSMSYNISVNASYASDFGVKLRLSVKTLYFEPGDYFTLNVTVENTGISDDDIVITPVAQPDSNLRVRVLGNITVRLEPAETAVVLIYVSSLENAEGEHIINITGVSTGSYAYGLTIGDYRHLTVKFNATEDQKPPDYEKPEDDSALQFTAVDLNSGFILAVIIIAIIVILGYVIYLKRKQEPEEKEPTFDKVAVFIKPKEEELADFIESKDEKRKRGREGERVREKVIDMQQGADGSFIEREKY